MKRVVITKTTHIEKELKLDVISQDTARALSGLGFQIVEIDGLAVFGLCEGCMKPCIEDDGHIADSEGCLICPECKVGLESIAN